MTHSTAVTSSTSRAGPTTMRAATVIAPGRIEVRQAPLPRPGDGEVRIRLEGCGVCASNVPPFEGRPWFEYPFAPGALGHEGWGRVDAVGRGVTQARVGDRVAFISDHAYAEYDCVPADVLVKLPPSLDGRPLPGEPLGCAINVQRRAAIEPGQVVAIVGVGFLGCLLTQLARRRGATVIAIGRRPFALRMAARLGAEHVIGMDDDEAVLRQVSRLTAGRMCDTVIECTGEQRPLDLAGPLTRVRGRLVIAGFHQDGRRQIDLQLWNWRGIDVINAHEREPRIYTHGMREAVDAIVAGELVPEPLYTHRYPLERLGESLQAARDRPAGFMKALVVMDDERR